HSSSSGRSYAAVPSQSCQANSYESLIPMARCSGESTKNNPPNDQNACPPMDCSPSWSRSNTFLPARASSVVATSPASPAPTTMTSYSMTLVPLFFFVINIITDLSKNVSIFIFLLSCLSLERLRQHDRFTYGTIRNITWQENFCAGEKNVRDKWLPHVLD